MEWVHHHSLTHRHPKCSPNSCFWLRKITELTSFATRRRWVCFSKCPSGDSDGFLNTRTDIVRSISWRKWGCSSRLNSKKAFLQSSSSISSHSHSFVRTGQCSWQQTAKLFQYCESWSAQSALVWPIRNLSRCSSSESLGPCWLTCRVLFESGPWATAAEYSCVLVPIANLRVLQDPNINTMRRLEAFSKLPKHWNTQKYARLVAESRQKASATSR